MGLYWFCLALGVTGLAVMALLGFGHDVGLHGGGPDLAQGHGGHHVGDGHGHGESAFGRLTALLSPRLLFSFLVGVGATGILARSFLVEPLLLGAALLGGVGFEKILIGPIWKFLFRFESRPALTLGSAILEEAEAVTDFDAEGQGLIKLELDGQVVQLLGTLTAEARAAGHRIRRGDRLRIEEVDDARNSCLVSFAGQARLEALP